MFSRRGSEGKTTRQAAPAEEDPKQQRTKFEIVKKKSKFSEFKHPQHLLVRREVFGDQSCYSGVHATVIAAKKKLPT